MMDPKQIVTRAILLGICLSPSIILAATATADHTNLGFIQEHGGVVITLFSGCFLLIGFFLMRTLSSNDRQHTEIMVSIQANQVESRKVNQKQWEAISNIANDFSRLKGEHDIIKEHCHHRRTDDIKEMHDHGRHTNGD